MKREAWIGIVSVGFFVVLGVFGVYVNTPAYQKYLRDQQAAADKEAVESEKVEQAKKVICNVFATRVYWNTPITEDRETAYTNALNNCVVNLPQAVEAARQAALAGR